MDMLLSVGKTSVNYILSKYRIKELITMNNDISMHADKYILFVAFLRRPLATHCQSCDDVRSLQWKRFSGNGYMM